MPYLTEYKKLKKQNSCIFKCIRYIILYARKEKTWCILQIKEWCVTIWSQLKK